MWDPVINSLGNSHSRMDYDDEKSIPNIALRKVVRKWVETHADVPGVYREYPVYEVATGTPWAFNQTRAIRCGSWEYPKGKEGRRLVPLIKSSRDEHSGPNRGLISVEKFSLSTVAVLDIPQPPPGTKSYILITQEGTSPPTCRGLYSFAGIVTPVNILNAANISTVDRQVVAIGNSSCKCYINIIVVQVIPDTINAYYKRHAPTEPAGNIIKKRK